jgi:hypothetical protein
MPGSKLVSCFTSAKCSKSINSQFYHNIVNLGFGDQVLMQIQTSNTLQSTYLQITRWYSLILLPNPR